MADYGSFKTEYSASFPVTSAQVNKVKNGYVVCVNGDSYVFRTWAQVSNFLKKQMGK